ncbi:acetylornithine transaminase [Aestuariimicrobium sp. T2.26MG-19.2B]|uniref:acetylornithine transaminase n=1 Tax=Aestuariimicrobium sp. T2.26MG-19.2B TaxID=3040679 RepID=UPI00247787F2|nr:acetylornithine transaminase [Aestuariimicrobium sp. T2.26MG-19.2B]CAI9398508.1 Acetylornithine aminotransferase [Aestuariimicrobium sp. T2.26MG-19.2B]
MSQPTAADLTLPEASDAPALSERYQQVMMNAFGGPKRVFVRGEGCHVWDDQGRRYLDLLSGLAVTALGHAHPAVLSAITSQLSTLGHVSNFFATPAQVTLAEKLVHLVAPASGTGQARVFFTNSGTEANEAAFKLTRLTGRTKIIAMEGSFHGRTMGALAITSNVKYREPFAPLPGDVTFVPYGDSEALAEAMDDRTAAVVIEPIQGENGVVVPPDDFLTHARELCDAHGALLWFDEVQTGMGRTGRWLASHPVTPDLVTLAKGLGNGFPVGACIGIGRAASLLQPGQHGTTFGGNPVAAIAGLAVIGVIERDGLLGNAIERGEQLVREVEGLHDPLVDHVRGAGLLRGIVLSEHVATSVSDALLDAGFIVNAPRPDVIRVAPPLIITEGQIGSFVQALATALRDARP